MWHNGNGISGPFPDNTTINQLNFIPKLILNYKRTKNVGLEKEDALNRARWRVGVGEITVRVG